MKVSIYKEVPGVKKEQEFFLKLVKAGEAVNLVLVDKKGEELLGGILLQIKKDMTLYRYTYIEDNLGLPLEEGLGKLKLGDSPD